ncbi:MAG: nitroreductase family protein [Methanomassiliicoccales archaeon]|jgi:nitroreductase
MDEVMENMYGRRSVRSYKDQVPTESTIKEIIKAGTFAANGGNMQGLRFVVVTDRKRLERYSTIAKGLTVAGMKQQLEAAPEEKKEWMQKMIKHLSDPTTNIFYNAPMAIFVFTAPNCLTPVEDASLAAGNMMLAAWSMAIGSCWIGFAGPLQYSPEFMAEAEAPSHDRLIASIIMGYPSKAPGKGHRNEPKIKWLK